MKKSPLIAVAALPVNRVDNYLIALDACGAGAVAGADFDPDAFDGLLLPGGGDIDPERYGEKMIAECAEPNEALDDMQIRVLERFVQAKKPVLGICRGIQVINVCFKGSLVQHIAQHDRHTCDETGADRVHAVLANEGSFLETLYGDRFFVNSAHHQAVKTLGKGLRLAAVSDDGVPEAVFHEALPVFGVQWHPERMAFSRRRADTVDGEPLFRFFLNLCTGR
ncbi:MAG: gamma-glutamyl-gamma-aminobutyrate hydrolase family protein [Clostridia bacterium]|nr:gamma-glutamyl-gamma-aminobutyrate hydrolase family protein [Clostridia bacterium]